MNVNKSKIILDMDVFEDSLKVEGIDCILEYLDAQDKNKSYSPNGQIFRLKVSQEEHNYSIIKICSECLESMKARSIKKRERFSREIGAFNKMIENGNNANVIEVFSTGTVTICDKNFLYYNMEEASYDLANLLKDQEITLPQRYQICFDIIKSIKTLHDNGIYHRDIKPGNFLIVDGQVKIADLGLVGFREADFFAAIDDDDEKIGPRHFMSPEATNKHLSNSGLDYQIDDKSDVFQLAKVLGFVLQDEIFSGFIHRDDLLTADNTGELHSIIENAMQYSQGRRCDIEELQEKFTATFAENYALT